MCAQTWTHSFRGKILTYWERRKLKSGMPRSRSVSYWQSWGRNPGFFGSGTNVSLGRNRLCSFLLQTQTCKVTANVTIHIRDAVFGSNGSHPLFLPEKKVGTPSLWNLIWQPVELLVLREELSFSLPHPQTVFPKHPISSQPSKQIAASFKACLFVWAAFAPLISKCPIIISLSPVKNGFLSSVKIRISG